MKSYQEHRQTRFSAILPLLAILIAIIFVIIAMGAVRFTYYVTVLWSNVKTNGKELRNHVTRLISSVTTSG
jgi:hypothetical protein